MVLYAENASWVDLKKHIDAKTVAILPIGAIEAHGPHLPLLTDTIISQQMSELAAKKIESKGFNAILLPPLSYTSCQFASNFSGTVNISPDTLSSLLCDTVTSLSNAGIKYILFASAHIDPTHVSVLRSVNNKFQEIVIYPDITRRKLAERLGEEFVSGSCHGGSFETSLVLAAKPQAVRKDLLPPTNHVNLAEAIKKGAKSFDELGMELAYCGNPQSASIQEGEHTFEILSDILVEAFLDHYISKQ